MPVELVSSAALTPFFSTLTSKSAAISRHTVVQKSQSKSFCPTQQGHPVGLLHGRLIECPSLPAVHLALGTFTGAPPNELAAS